MTQEGVYDEMYRELEEMGIPVIEKQLDVDEILNERREIIASLQDPVTVNEYMVGIAQFLMYARQQYNIYSVLYAKKKRTYEQMLLVEAHGQTKGKSLAERKSIALENNPELKEMKAAMESLEIKKGLLEKWVDECKEFQNSLKRIHDDLIEERDYYRRVKE